MSAAPSWPLVIVDLVGANLPEHGCHRSPGLNFLRFRRPKAQFQGTLVLNLFFRASERKTTRGALDRTRPSDRFRHGLQKPEIANSPSGLRGATPPSPPHEPCFRAAVPIWDGNRGDSRVKSPHPHKFSCSTCARASLLQAPLSSRHGRA